MSGTHCLPNGQLGTSELPVPNMSGATMTVFGGTIPVGQRRGIIVYNHGLYTSQQQSPVPPSTISPGGVADFYSAFASSMANSHCQNLAQLGWVVLAITAQEDTYAGNPMGGVYADAGAEQTAGGYGSRYLASTLHTWDHVYAYIQATYGYGSGTSTAWRTTGGPPIVISGFSIGSWRGLQILQNRPGQIAAFIFHEPATYFESVGYPALYTPGYTFGLLDWAGLDVTPTFLSSIGSIPGIIGYGTLDSAVGYGGSSTLTAYAAGVATLTSTAGFIDPALAIGGVPCYASFTGSTGGQINFSYTAIVGNTLTGCVTLTTIGTPTGTRTCNQSSISSILSTAIAAGRNVTGNQTAEWHTLSSGDAGFFASVGGTLVTTGGTITINTTQGSFGASVGGSQNGLTTAANGVSVWNGTGWTTITVTTVVGNTITYSSASANSPYALRAPIVNTGTPTAGIYSNVSYAYYLDQVINPNRPANG